MTLAKPVRHRFVIVIAIVNMMALAMLAACAPQSPREASMSAETGKVVLTNEAIFRDRAYKAKVPGTVRWLEDGSGYSALETVEAHKDTELELDELGEPVNPYREIVKYDPATLARTVLFSLEQLTPEGAEGALAVDDYQWSDDGTRLLVYANARKVWRQRSRGDYWILELDSGELWPLGGDQREPSQMMFGKLSKDAARFAYVWDNNIYVQNLATRTVTALTTDASDTIINGRFDWAYEEEFSILDGFRWSPDSQRIL